MRHRSMAEALASRSPAFEGVKSGLRWSVVVAVVLVVLVVVPLGCWSVYRHSARGRAETDVAGELADGTTCLLSTDPPHIDRDTGLLVAQGCRTIYCSRGPMMAMENGHSSEPDYMDAWNAAVRRALAEGQACEPRFTDRITKAEAVRARFNRERATVVALPADTDVRIGAFSLRWAGHMVLVHRPNDDVYWRWPVGGCLQQPDFAGLVATALVPDDGRTLWVRLATEAGDDRWFLVIDLATGAHLYVFPASS
jgi:hypothetical protein